MLRNVSVLAELMRGRGGDVGFVTVGGLMFALDNSASIPSRRSRPAKALTVSVVEMCVAACKQVPEGRSGRSIAIWAKPMPMPFHNIPSSAEQH